jgi:hypothetical protein
LGFWVLGFRFRVSGLGFGVQEFGVRDLRAREFGRSRTRSRAVNPSHSTLCV